MLLSRSQRMPLPVQLAAYLGAYLLLEWSTYRPDVSPYGITPWNPSAGLSLAVLLLGGLGWAPAFALAMLLADVTVRQVPFAWWVEFAEVVVTVGTYAAVAATLVQINTGFDLRQASMRDLCALVAAILSGAMAVAALYVGVLLAAGVLVPAHLVDAVLRHWAGDVIGIMTMTPFLLVLPHLRRPRFTLEIGLQLMAILLVTALVVAGDAGVREQLSYLLFLPVMWIAVRHGFAGASAGLFLMQTGLMMALHARPSVSIDVAGLQAVLLILLLAGLAIGVLTSDRERVALRLRQQQATMSRVARSAGMGSLSASLAHETSQPLTAIGNFVRAAQNALSADPIRIAAAREAIGEAVVQVERTSEVIRRLKRLFEVGRVDCSPQDAAALIEECRALMAPDAAEQGVELVVSAPIERLEVEADRIQIVLALTNLVRNSLEALELPTDLARTISLRAHATSPRHVAFEVTDTGAGFPPQFELSTHTLGDSDKPHGLGVGLALCRSIVEAHGGRLDVDKRAVGATVRFTLKRTSGDSHATAA